jgi:hypothetical protein
MKYAALLLGRLLKNCNPDFALGSFMLFLYQLKNHESPSDRDGRANTFPDFSGIDRQTVRIDQAFESVIGMEDSHEEHGAIDFIVAARRVWSEVCACH